MLDLRGLSLVIFGIYLVELINTDSSLLENAIDGSNVINPDGSGSSPCLSNPCDDYTVCHDLGEVYACLCPIGYAGASCKVQSEPRKTDLLFLLDSSRSVTHSNWDQVLRFVDKVSALLSEIGDINRLGIISFASEAELQIVYNNGENVTEMREHIYELPFMGGTTNIAGALRLAREEFFAHANVNLPGLENIALLITDGTSTVDRDQTVVEARRDTEQGIIIFGVGLGTEATDRELVHIVTQPASMHLVPFRSNDPIGSIVRSIQSHSSDYDMSSIKGEQGQAGVVGLLGSNGRQGVAGAKGHAGPPGNKGLKGDMGEAGLDGIMGRTGDKGQRGATGLPGATGAPSFVKGRPGDKGAKGDYGDAPIGSSGTRGLPGIKGEFGPQGLPGISPQGERGSVGMAGMEGAPGRPGPAGESGPSGLKGVSGEKGPKGFNGDAGIPGIPGPAGKLILPEFPECSLACEYKCKHTLVGFVCECPEGYELAPDDIKCIDVDECLINNGGCEQECTNKIGSFSCSCKIGYTLSKNMHNCNDFNECCADESLPRCSSSELCLNTLGSFKCLSKRIAYIPKPKANLNAAQNNTLKLTSVWKTTEMFIGLILWSAIISLLILIIILLLWFNDDKSVGRLRDAHVIEQKYRKTKRMSVASNFIFPRFSTEDLTDCNPIVSAPTERLYMRAQSGRAPTQRYSKGAMSTKSRRSSGASVTIQSPGGHVTSINA